MTWIKLNDNVPRHPKIAGLSDRAFRAWIGALCYSSEFLTDGVLPVAFLVTVSRRVQDEIVASGLWRVEGNLVTIHDYLEHQRDKASIRTQRDYGKSRQRKFRNAVSNASSNAVSNGEVTQPEERRVDKNVPPTPFQGVRIRREHREHAKAILKAQLGYCKHDQQCVNQTACCERIAQELAQKAKAS